MANAWVSEFRGVGVDQGRMISAARDPVRTQKVEFTTASSPTLPFHADTIVVCVVADADCHVEFGADPTADDESLFIPHGERFWMVVGPGQTVSIYDGSS